MSKIPSVDVHTYADDTELYISFNADSRAGRSAALSAMQNCIANIRKWMLQDRLRLNDEIHYHRNETKTRQSQHIPHAGR